MTDQHTEGREPGFYWLRERGTVRWTVAKFDGGGFLQWSFFNSLMMLDEPEVAERYEIGERIAEPRG